MTARRFLLLVLVVLAGSLIPSAAGGGAAGGGGDDPPQSPPTSPPLGRFLALTATTFENAQEWLSPSGYGAYLDVLHAYPSGGGG